MSSQLDSAAAGSRDPSQSLEHLFELGGMRLGSWDECVGLAKTRIPQNLGYFWYCEGAFRERAISDVQLVFTKPANRMGAA